VLLLGGQRHGVSALRMQFPSRLGCAAPQYRLPKSVLVAAFWLLAAAGSCAQNPTLVSLDQAIDLALTHNHTLKATRTLILQNQAQEITANLRPNPTLGADSQFIPIFTPQDFSADDLNQNQQFDIGLSYLFERGRKRQSRLQAARDQTAATRVQIADAERTLAFNVGQQFVCHKSYSQNCKPGTRTPFRLDAEAYGWIQQNTICPLFG